MYKACVAYIVTLFIWLTPVYAWENDSGNLWDEIRNTFQLTQNACDPAVQLEIDWYRRHPKTFHNIALDALPYLYYIHNEVRRMGLPGEVALIPMIESAYNPFIYSKAGAAGLWQLMPGTGSGLGLRINFWYDGRRDVVASTQAALTYFQRLNRFFSGDWLLTIAAYDSGEGTILRAIEMNSGQRDFWSLSLPKETQKYVPKLLALVEIIKNPESYNLNLPYIPNKPYFSHVQVGKPMDLGAAAQLAHVPLNDLYRLNPGFNRWETGPDGPHTLLLPVEHAKILAAHLLQHPLSDEPGFHYHKVQKGEKLHAIAEKYHLSVDELKAQNHLASNYVRAGSTLKIPQAKEALDSRKKVILAYQTENIGPHRVMHEVKISDSIEAIAARYHVTANAIRFWNHILAGQSIKTGSILTIWTKLTASQIVQASNTIRTIKHHKHHHRGYA